MILNIPFSAMIGPVLATVRGLTGESQGAFAERAGMAGEQLSRYERSKVIPDTDVAMRLLASGGWRLAAISVDEAATLVEREAVVRAAYAWRYAIVTPGADVGASESALVAAVDALDEEQQAVRDSGVAMPTEELIALRSANAQQHDALLRLRTEREQLGREVAALRLAVQAAAAVLDDAIEATR